MSVGVVLSRRAETDLIEIWRWTYQQFGEQQADRYLDQLDEVMQECGRSPSAGRDRSEVRAGYRSRLAARHLIFYTVDDQQVVIQRVLHASMEIDTHLPD